MAMLSIDVIVATFNRARVLRGLLHRLVAALLPPGLVVGVTVVDAAAQPARCGVAVVV